MLSYIYSRQIINNDRVVATLVAISTFSEHRVGTQVESEGRQEIASPSWNEIHNGFTR